MRHPPAQQAGCSARRGADQRNAAFDRGTDRSRGELVAEGKYAAAQAKRQAMRLARLATTAISSAASTGLAKWC
jgi:hypothetical protein